MPYTLVRVLLQASANEYSDRDFADLEATFLTGQSPERNKVALEVSG